MSKRKYTEIQCSGNYPTPFWLVADENTPEEPIASASDRSVAQRIASALSLESRIEHKHIQWFVMGAIHEWNEASGANFDDDGLTGYIGSTVNIVIGYLNGTRVLDGKCSDLQCTIAIEAKKIFTVEGLRRG